MIALGLNYIGMKEQNVYNDIERNNIIFKKSTFIYPVGGRKCDGHIIITLTVADRMTYITDETTMDTWTKCDHISLIAMIVTMIVILMETLRYS